MSSLRLIIGFAMSFDATTWVEQLGFLRSFSIYAGALAVASLGLPLVYVYGKRIRKYTSRKLDSSSSNGRGGRVTAAGHELSRKTSHKVIPVEIIDKSTMNWPDGVEREV